MNLESAHRQSAIGNRQSSAISVLPNRNSLGLAAVLAAMWYAGASQNNGAANVLCFTLAGVAAVSAIHAWANLRGLRISAETIRPMFAGEETCVTLLARGERVHSAITVREGKSVAARFDEITPAEPRRGEVRFVAERRGRFDVLHLRVASLFPLGFFTARRRVALRQPYFVYPAPRGAEPLPRPLAPARRAREGARIEGDDFAGTRPWRPGESQRHIDWKAAARGQPLLTKQWSGESGDVFHFAWHDLAHLAPEPRLEQLARWVVLAGRAGASFALTLPGIDIPPARGEAHFHECLRALAEFPP